jgi:hypothetical protein
MNSGPRFVRNEVAVSSRRTMILIAAVLIGVVAAFGLYQYVQKVEEDAKPNPVTVYVIKNSDLAGRRSSRQRRRSVEKMIPAEFRPDTYVTNKASWRTRSPSPTWLRTRCWCRTCS